MKRITMTVPAMMAMAMALQASTIPLDLPKPDGKSGNPKKPVKVYILAGQSNMVGMGDISGARPEHASVFLSADPAILPGVMPAGSSRKKDAGKWLWSGVSALASHGVYQSDDPKSEKGAVVAVHKGAYDPNADYSKLKPASTAKVALGTLAVLAGFSFE